MKLKYKILWIEDELDSIERPKNQIQRYLEDNYGFECSEDDVVIKDYDEFEEEYIYEENQRKRVKDSIKEFDLLLVDFNLGEEEQTGDKLIDIIRDGIYSEILFYSSELESINKKLNNHFIDGVFTSDREHLEDKIKKLINVTIKKVQDVNNLRGLIMAEVAELDRIKETILKTYSEKNKCGTIENYIIEKLNKSYADNLKKVAKYTSSSLNDIFNNLYVDSDKRARAIKKVEDSFDENSYRKNVLSTRNKFAHIEEMPGNDKDGNSCKLIGDIPFTEEKCIEIRKEIREYKKILENIQKSI
ncbi:hypothetical protein L5F37_08355 [Aliarcobacter butzleri]|uniref:hypothetical protein n=1 Tax=Aliarcobacter butzleri TaxID=28197 RepID=UPI001EDA1DA4|nr:hypothetical protein [Aliarcobacter butzleri]MCG3663409.1 hypothetical protein [Aliarcobacter butzleri]